MEENRHQPKGWGEGSAIPSGWGGSNASKSTASPWATPKETTCETPEPKKSAPVEETAPSEEKTSVEKTVPAKEAVPAEVTAPAEEVAPAEVIASVEETVLAKETAPHEEKPPVEEIASAKESITADPAEVVSDTESLPPKKRGKSGVVIAIAVVVAIVIAVVWILASDGTHRGDEKEQLVATTTTAVTSTTHSTIESTTTTTITTVATTVTTTAATVTTAPPAVVDISTYVGTWVNSAQPTERELMIHSVTDGVVTFSLWYYRLNSVEYVTAHIVDVDYAVFDIAGMQGNLWFQADGITMIINDSDIPYMPAETQKFDIKQESSLMGYEDTTVPDTVEVMAGDVCFEYMRSSTYPSYTIDHFEAQLVEQGDTQDVYRVQAKGQKTDEPYSMMLYYETYDEQMNYLDNGTIGDVIWQTFDISEYIVLDHDVHYVAIYLY